MFDFSWAELALIAAVALVVIGPKDLPRALRTAGMWARKARTISREFQSSIEQMVREAELDDVKKELQAATSFNLESEIKKTVDPDGSIGGSLTPPVTPPQSTPAIAAPTAPAAEAMPEIPQREIAPLPVTSPPLPDPETPSQPEPETHPHTEAEGHAAPVPSHSGGTP